MTPRASPTVSIIVPTCERREYVCRAVRSVFAQRYQDWELIVVDDGSTDGTGKALRAFGPRLRYVWQENRGVSAARNAGLRLARGEIVAFLDSDDRWLPDHLETVVAMLARYPEAVLASTCPSFRVGGRQQVAGARLVDFVPIVFISNQVGYVPCVAVRRDALLTVGGFDDRLEVGEDNVVFMQLALLGPFTMLNRRTAVPQYTRGSLKERGVGRAGYLETWRLMAEEVIRCVPGEDSELAARAEGGLHYCEALEALFGDDCEAAAKSLERACEAWPELSASPALVTGRLENISWERTELLRLLSTAATLWPDPRSDTALFLRALAAARALRAGQARLAVRLVSRWSLRRTPGFVRRTRPLWARRARKSLQRLFHRGKEAVIAADG
jgi:glycosyl transferase family 2